MNKNVDNNLIDDALVTRVAKRVDDFKKGKENLNLDPEYENSKVETLSSVFEVPKSEIQHLFYKEYIEQQRNLSLKDKLIVKLTTYPKELSLFSIIIATLIIFTFTFNRTSHVIENKGKVIIPEHVKKDIAIQEQKTELVTVFLSIQMIQNKQLHYRQEHQIFSKNLSDLGLVKEKVLPSMVNKIKLTRNGKMTLSLNKKFGKNIYMSMQPIDFIKKDYRGNKTKETKWKCKTNYKSSIRWCNNKVS